MTAADPKVATIRDASPLENRAVQNRAKQEYYFFLNNIVYNIFYFSARPPKYLLSDFLQKKCADPCYRLINFNL